MSLEIEDRAIRGRVITGEARPDLKKMDLGSFFRFLQAAKLNLPIVVSDISPEEEKRAIITHGVLVYNPYVLVCPSMSVKGTGIEENPLVRAAILRSKAENKDQKRRRMWERKMRAGETGRYDYPPSQIRLENAIIGVTLDEKGVLLFSVLAPVGVAMGDPFGGSIPPWTSVGVEGIIPKITVLEKGIDRNEKGEKLRVEAVLLPDSLKNVDK